jgi:glutamate-5-semialdehyde dehydrogenase
MVKSKLIAAKNAFHKMNILTASDRKRILLQFSNLIKNNKNALLTANKKDLTKQKNKISSAMFERLKLDEHKLEILCDGINSIAKTSDPVGRLISTTELDKGLILEKRSVPIGVIAVIFESRPDVIPQILALILKSGNVAVLKGGKEAQHTNLAFMNVVKKLESLNPKLPTAWAQLFLDRKHIHELLKHDDLVDLVIPRGSNELVKTIQDNTKIPVLGHADGVCHVYVHEKADLNKALEIVLDAKTQYPAVCNAAETILVDEEIASKFLPAVAMEFGRKGVQVFGDKNLRKWFPKISNPKSWHTEYGDLRVSIRLVDGLKSAIAHINEFGSHHTDAIVTSDKKSAKTFCQMVDSATVVTNASTRFADGYRFGMGAEVGISTNKTHARGPVGIDGLMIYKYFLTGQGHLVKTYVGPGAKKFTHKKI